MDKLHKRPYLGHPRYQKMITMTGKDFFWPNMKKEEAEYLAHCIECQQVKAGHQHQFILLHPLPILEWKWKIVSMEFITRLPQNVKKHDSIMVVADKLCKENQFIPVNSMYKSINIANIFLKETFRLHGVPKIVILVRDAKFTRNFLEGFMYSIRHTYKF